MKTSPIFNDPVPQTYGEAIVLYPWLKCESHEWDNRTTAENAIWLIKEMQAALAAKDAELAAVRQVLHSCYTDKAILKNLLEKEHNDLVLNAKMLARQTDLAREAETKLADLREKVGLVLDTWERVIVQSCSIGLQTHSKAITALRAAVEKPEPKEGGEKRWFCEICGIYNSIVTKICPKCERSRC